MSRFRVGGILSLIVLSSFIALSSSSAEVASGSGGKIAFVETVSEGTGKKATFRADIFVLDPVTGNQTPIDDISDSAGVNTSGATETQPAWSPDGDKLAFMSNRDGDFEIFVYDFNSAQLIQITNNRYYDESPDFSPDGNRLVFSGWDKSGNADLFIAELGTLSVSNLTRTRTVMEKEPDWSSTDVIAMSASYGSDLDIHTIRPDGTGLSRVTNFNSEDELSPSWSADGSQIAFWTAGNGAQADEVWVIGAADSNGDGVGDNLSKVVDGEFALYNRYPAFSPDGSKLVFTTSKAGYRLTLFTVNLDGTGEQQVSTFPSSGKGSHGHPDWSALPATSAPGPDPCGVPVEGLCGIG